MLHGLPVFSVQSERKRRDRACANRQPALKSFQNKKHIFDALSLSLRFLSLWIENTGSPCKIVIKTKQLQAAFFDLYPVVAD